MRRVNPFILSTVSLAALIASPAFAEDSSASTAAPEALATGQGSDAQAPNCDVPEGTALPEGCEPQVADAAPAAADDAAITVTGSRIRRPNLESPLPVTSVGGEEFFQTGDVSVGDKLAELPSIRSTFTQSNSTRFLGTAGLNLLDLRGLGTVRTLVLVNGRRHVGGDVLSSGVSVDVNTIPADLIERVDVVTGGNSAVYGSDAIAGVVNFVLKQDYDGFMVRAQGGQSKYGDADSYFISALWGTNFADGRGNIALNVEYARRDQAWGDERPWLHTALTVVDSDPASAPSDGNPDRVLNPDFRSVTFSAGGNVRIGGRSNSGAPSPFFCGTDPQGNRYNCPYIFGPDGRLTPLTGQRTGIGPSGQMIGGNGFGFFEGHAIQVTPQLDRYNINLNAHIEMSPAVVPFFEAKLSRTDSFGTGASGPFFMSGGVLGDPLQFFSGTGNRERISLSNPYLNPEDSAFIRDSILASGINNCNFAPLTNTDRARLANGTFRFCSQAAFYGLPSRTEEARRDTFRIVGGVRGDLGGAWNYEISANYGQLKERTKIGGNMDVQRFLLAMDAVRDPNTGEIVCASQINPSRAFGYYPWFYYTFYGADYPGADPNAQARLENDIAQCTPINTLGGQFTQAQQDYLLLDSVAKGRTNQLDLLAFISGDSSKWFELPGGPVGIVLGVEYRADDVYYKQDEQVQLGYTFYNAIPTFSAPKSKVKEAFGEIRLPIAKDMPFLEELEIAAAARVSDYSLGTTGSVWAWNLNANWSPLEGLRFRGNVARAVRAPNQVEFFTPPGQNFSLVNDPCDVNQVGAGSASRAANCLAAGIPAGTNIAYSSSLPFLSGGFADLRAETSKSYTLGGVFTPAFVPGLSLSVDYYKIRIKDLITAPTAQQVLNACYDLASLDNPFCALFQRADETGAGANNGLPYGIISNSLTLTPFNYAKLNARGLDLEAAYRGRIGNLGRLDTRFTYTHVFELTQFIDPSRPDFGDRLLSELGNPKNAWNWNTNFQTGRFTFGWQTRFIGKMVTNLYEDFFEFEGRAPQNEDWADKTWFPRRYYHDARVAVDIGPKYNFYMGVDNLTNQKPPYATTGLGGGSGIYDAIGRFFYAGVKANF
jgi:outer membrane receptor protein involved in Fe transport